MRPDREDVTPGICRWHGIHDAMLQSIKGKLEHIELNIEKLWAALNMRIKTSTLIVVILFCLGTVVGLFGWLKTDLGSMRAGLHRLIGKVGAVEDRMIKMETKMEMWHKNDGGKYHDHLQYPGLEEGP